jgi:hypothetical protein
MTEFEQFQEWIEMRILERRATRAEVYALRRFRRKDSALTRVALMGAYINAQMKPLAEAAGRFLEALAPVVDQFAKLAHLFAEAEVEMFAETDLGEFDNRAHDWMREAE